MKLVKSYKCYCADLLIGVLGCKWCNGSVDSTIAFQLHLLHNQKSVVCAFVVSVNEQKWAIHSHWLYNFFFFCCCCFWMKFNKAWRFWSTKSLRCNWFIGLLAEVFMLNMNIVQSVYGKSRLKWMKRERERNKLVCTIFVFFFFKNWKCRHAKAVAATMKLKWTHFHTCTIDAQFAGQEQRWW